MSPPISADEAAAGQDHGHPHGSHLGSSLTYPRSASIVGYCLLPLVLVSTLGIVVPLDGLFGYIVTISSIMWCSYSSSSMFTVAGKQTHNGGVMQHADFCRPHDFYERTCRVPYGTVLWQFRHHGDIQLSWHWAIGQGGSWTGVRGCGGIQKDYVADNQHTASGVRYYDVDTRLCSDSFGFHKLSVVEPIGVQQLLSAS